MKQQKSKPSIVIRPYQSSDLPQILQLFKETVHAINQRDYNTEQLQAWAPNNLDTEKWAKSLAEHIAYVAVLDTKVVGFADMNKAGYFDRLFVHKDYQGKLISRRLGLALYQDALKLGLKEVSADVSITALPLAKRMGFQVVKQQTVEKNGQQFINYHMVIKIEPDLSFK